MSESLDSYGTNMARMITFLRAHKRLITFSWVAFCAFWLTPSWSEVGPFGFLFFFAREGPVFIGAEAPLDRVHDRRSPRGASVPGLDVAYGKPAVHARQSSRERATEMLLPARPANCRSARVLFDAGLGLL
jgi:hypothetical protein